MLSAYFLACDNCSPHILLTHYQCLHFTIYVEGKIRASNSNPFKYKIFASSTKDIFYKNSNETLCVITVCKHRVFGIFLNHDNILQSKGNLFINLTCIFPV